MGIRKNAALYSCAIALAAGASALTADDNENALLARAQQMFKPLPTDAGTPQRPLTPERVALGRALFFETRVSSDGKGSCGGCHNTYFYGTDALPRSVGVGGKVIPRNAPTVFNTALQFVQHYGGNRADVEEQAVKALVSPLAYGNADYAAAESRLRALPGYRAMFEKAFPGETEPVTAENGAKRSALEHADHPPPSTAILKATSPR
jgi:cytochrome c peroxidase